MEKEDLMIIKVFLGIILVVFMIILVFVALKQPTNTTSTIVVSNSYNTYSYSYEDGRYVDRNYDKTYKKERLFLRYSDTSRHRTSEGIFGEDVNIYTVYVRNRENVGGYFTVKFYLRDNHRDADIERIMKYIGPHEEKSFTFRDVYRGGHGYADWDYEVISETVIQYTLSKTYSVK